MSIYSIERVGTAVEPATPGGLERELREESSGLLEGMPYEIRKDVLYISYADFVSAIKDAILERAPDEYRHAKAQEPVWPIEQYTDDTNHCALFNSRLAAEMINGQFDARAVATIKALFSTAKEFGLPEHMVFTAQDRPYTPWEGPVQEWLADRNAPYELTGLGDMYGEDERPQLHFRQSDGSDL